MRVFPILALSLLAGCRLGLDALGGYGDDTGALDLGDDGASGDGGSGSGGSGSGDSGSGSDGGSGSDSGSGGGSGSGSDSGSGSGSDSGSGSGGSGSGSSSGGSSSGGGSGGATDADGDGYTSDVDCDDADRYTYPGAAWQESSSLCMTDQDGDGYGDQYPASGVTGGSDCDDTDPSMSGADADGDGWSTCAGDCDDRTSSRSPGATDTPYDGIDQDCDGSDSGTIVTASGTTGYIYDYTTTWGEATVSGCNTVYDVEVTVNISHTWAADLGIALHEPTYTNYAILQYYDYYSSSGISGTYSSSGGGTLTPYESLSYVTGGSGNGVWVLEIYDEAYYDEGSLNSWSLTLYCD